MAAIGVDLGVRSFAAAILAPDGHLQLFTYQALLTSKVADQVPTARADELSGLALALSSLVQPHDIMHIEEPPLAGLRNVRIFLKLAQASAACAVGAAHKGALVSFVPVDTWKKETVGRGGASKDFVASWLEHTYPVYFEQCKHDQNLIDATCIAIRAAGTRGLGEPRAILVAG